MPTSIENFSDLRVKQKSNSISSFLKKTFDLLNQPNFSDCIQWASNGIGFIIKDQQIFSSTVLPKYFKHSNYSSFVRQLNMYNFCKIRENNFESYFHHQFFNRDNKDLISYIKRKPEKKKRKKEQVHQKDEDLFPVFSHNQSRVKLEMKKKQIIQILQTEVSKRLMGQYKENNSTAQKITKGNLVSETQFKQVNENLKEKEKRKNSNSIISQKNIFSIEDDDRLSINEQITEKFIVPRFNTNQLFNPSTNNLFPFSTSIQPSTFSFFF